MTAFREVLRIRIAGDARRLIIDQDDFQSRRLIAVRLAARRTEGDPQDDDAVEQRRQKAGRQHAVVRRGQTGPKHIARFMHFGCHAALNVLWMASASIAPISTACLLFSSRMPVGLVTLISVT